MTLELPTPFRQLIDDLRAKTQAESASEVIRRALSVYNALVELSEDRDVHLVVKRDDGKELRALLMRGTF